MKALTSAARFFSLTLIALLVGTGLAAAHFNHFQPRVIHVAENADGIHLYVRVPLPLEILPNDWKGLKSGMDVPFSEKAPRPDGTWDYRIEPSRLSPESIAQLKQQIASAYEIHSGGEPVSDKRIGRLVISQYHLRRSVRTLADAEFNLQKNAADVVPDTPFSVFDAVVDFEFILPGRQLDSGLLIKSSSGERLRMIERMANIVVVNVGEEPKEFATLGVLNQNIEPTRHSLAGVRALFLSGLEHILIGWDHVIFVIMIALSSATLAAVAIRATAFTIGHSITLACGVLGYVPTGTWFIPFVEMSIAATLLYAGLMIIFEKSDAMNALIVFSVGLIHGLGFSFVLNEVFAEAGGMSIANLVGFNLGIEAGQILIYAIAAPTLIAAEKLFSNRPTLVRGVVALPLVLVSAYWVYERALTLVSVAA